MRRLIFTVAGAAALASASMANAAVTVNAGTVVNLNDPNPSTSVVTATLLHAVRLDELRVQPDREYDWDE